MLNVDSDPTRYPNYYCSNDEKCFQHLVTLRNMVALSERVTVLRNNAGEFFIIIVNPVIVHLNCIFSFTFSIIVFIADL